MERQARLQLVSRIYDSGTRKAIYQVYSNPISTGRQRVKCNSRMIKFGNLCLLRCLYKPKMSNCQGGLPKT
jgi:hypothetical protein